MSAHPTLIKSNHYKIATWLLVVFALGLRLLGLSKGMWLDEIQAISISTDPNFIATLQGYNYPPAYFAILRLWSNISTSEPYLRFLSVTFGISTVIIVIKWLKHYSMAASLLGGTLVATMPFLIRYSQEVQSYPLLILSTAITFYAAHKIAFYEETLRWYILLCAATALSTATHMTGIFTLIMVAVYLLPSFLSHSNGKVRAFKFVAFMMIPSLTFLFVYFYFQGNTKDSSWWIPPASLSWITRQLKYLFSYWTLQTFPVTKYALLISIGGLAFGNWRRNWGLLAAALVYTAIVILVSLIVIPIFLARTLLPAIIPLIGFVSIQATSIKFRPTQYLTIAGLCMISALSVFGWVTTDAYIQVEPWRATAQYVQQNYEEGDLIVYYPEYISRPMQYYLLNIPTETALKIGIAKPIQETEQELAQLKNNNRAQQLFLIVRTSDSQVQKDTESHTALQEHLKSIYTSYTKPYVLDNQIKVTMFTVEP